MHTNKAFFSKPGHFLSIFKKDRGGLPLLPAICTPKLIYFLKRG